MDIKIYQSYFDAGKLASLDSSFIPHDVSTNENPELREYPLLKNLYEQNKEFDGYWGMVSWRWKEKTNISGNEFISWASQEPGYDFYHANHDLMNPEKMNIFQHGNAFHNGMLKCFQRISDALGLNVNLNTKYPPEYFITCHYYVAKNDLWAKLIDFMNKVHDLSITNQQIKEYMHGTSSNYRNSSLINYSFVMERMPTLFLLAHPEYKVKAYPFIQPHVPSVLRRG